MVEIIRWGLSCYEHDNLWDPCVLGRLCIFSIQGPFTRHSGWFSVGCLCMWIRSVDSKVVQKQNRMICSFQGPFIDLVFSILLSFSTQSGSIHPLIPVLSWRLLFRSQSKKDFHRMRKLSLRSQLQKQVFHKFYLLDWQEVGWTCICSSSEMFRVNHASLFMY